MPRKTIKRNFFEVNGRSFYWLRSKDRRVRVYEKGRRGMVGSFKQKRANKDNFNQARTKSERRVVKEKVKVEPERKVEAPPKEKIYRSSIVISYISMSKDNVEYRVWIHTRKPEIDEADLNRWMSKLTTLFPTNTPLELDKMEENREIDEDEMLPTDEFNIWWGYAEFKKEADESNPDKKTFFQYYAKSVGDRLVSTQPFRVVNS